MKFNISCLNTEGIENPAEMYYNVAVITKLKIK